MATPIPTAATAATRTVAWMTRGLRSRCRSTIIIIIIIFLSFFSFCLSINRVYGVCISVVNGDDENDCFSVLLFE